MLEILELSLEDAGMDHSPGPGCEIVELPRLLRLDLRDYESNIGEILQYLSFPSTTLLFLSTDVTEADGLISTMLPRDNKKFLHLSQVHCLVFDATKNISIVANNLHLKFSWALFDTNDEMYTKSRFLLIQMLDQLSKSSSIRELHVTMNSGFSLGIRDWYSILRRTPRICELYFSHGSRGPGQEDNRFDLCRALCVFHPQPGNLLCPALERLTLNQFDFEDATNVSILEILLVLRRLKKLELPGAHNLERKKAKRFEKFVGKLKYDLWEDRACSESVRDLTVRSLLVIPFTPAEYWCPGLDWHQCLTRS
jgi:hypothetical protein